MALFAAVKPVRPVPPYDVPRALPSVRADALMFDAVIVPEKVGLTFNTTAPEPVLVVVPVPPEVTAKAVPKDTIPADDMVIASVVPLLTTKWMAFDVVVPIARSADVDVKNTLLGTLNAPLPDQPDEFMPKSPK